MNITFKWYILLIFFLSACDSSNFVGDGQTTRKSEKKSEDLLAEGEVKQPEEKPEPEEVPQPDPPVEEEDPAPEEEKQDDPPPQEEEKPEFTDKVQEFTYGDPNPQVDYLFIIDNSVSMNVILDKVNLGFRSILEDTSIFSNDSKVAVMNTMIGQMGENADLNITSDLVRTYPGIELEPGFLSLVDFDSYKVYMDSNDVPQNRKDRWALEPCTEQWFSPTQTHSAGHYCFEAASQISASALGVEAGIKAFEQFLTKNQATPIFRDTAIVNVIFVSDTHDPGIGGVDQEYFDSRLDYTAFKAKLEAIQPVRDLKFHAIAPVSDRECSSERLNEQSYFTLALASQGQTGTCLLDNYTELMKNLIANGKISSPEFKLDAAPEGMPEVHVNGAKITEFEFSEETLTVTIPGLDPYAPAEVAIHYKVPATN